ncbi:hypothetical protein ACWEFY_19925, partial [Nocardia sp. NPDC004750]
MAWSTRRNRRRGRLGKQHRRDASRPPPAPAPPREGVHRNHTEENIISTQTPRIAVVTGAARGIGAAVARRLAAD